MGIWLWAKQNTNKIKLPLKWFEHVFFSIKTLKLLLYFYVSKAYFQNRNLLVEYFFFFKLTKWVSSLIVPQSRIACTFLFHSMYFKQPFSKDRLFYKMAETTPEKNVVKDRMGVGIMMLKMKLPRLSIWQSYADKTLFYVESQPTYTARSNCASETIRMLYLKMKFMDIWRNQERKR